MEKDFDFNRIGKRMPYSQSEMDCEKSVNPLY